MNPITLKTHSVYPEISPSADGHWEAKLITRSGEIKERFHGRVQSKDKSLLEIRKLITKNAYLEITKIIPKYEY